MDEARVLAVLVETLEGDEDTLGYAAALLAAVRRTSRPGFQDQNT